jgi:phage/plasmid-associated DNA primase
LIVRSSGLVGIQVQNLIVSSGVGGNGKSIFNELMISSVGNYGYNLSSTCLTQEIKSDANPELANLHNKRYVMSSEPPSEKAICCSAMKEITGNTILPVRGLYESKCETRLKCTWDLDLNGLPKFDVVDDAVNRRIRAIP